ncbi:MAG: hypothetical protein HGA61_01145 [Candidatus Moranbacteria bacterium]|nr:hypothetical protein [Candidatus Moranbacteria bacterium]
MSVEKFNPNQPRKGEQEHKKAEILNQGLQIGQTVVHPSEYADKWASTLLEYTLKEIDGETATVWFPPHENTIKQFPLNELVDSTAPYAKDRAFYEEYKENAYIMIEAFRRAREIARKEGLAIGQIVTRPSGVAVELKEINGDIATIGTPGGNQDDLKIPLCELYDPNVALELAKKIQLEEISKKLNRTN